MKLLALLLVALCGQAVAPRQGEKTGCIPLCDMTAQDRYKGEDGGLYGGGRNEPPKAHAEAAKAEAEKIQPLDADGKPAANGKVVLLSNGMSNTSQETQKFIELTAAPKNGALVIVNGAFAAQAALEWPKPECPAWSAAEGRLKKAGVTPKQVQIVWLKQALMMQPRYGAFPAHAKKLEEETGKILRLLKSRYPNLRIVYVSSRIYAGYAKIDLNPEPHAYECAFSVRSLILDQIKGNKELNYDPARGEVKAPLLLWGPYLWGDGVNPRKCDGLVWNESDLFEKDGTHPSPSGCEKVAQVMIRFFKNDPYVKKWFPK